MSKKLESILESAVVVGAVATIPLILLEEENPAAQWVQVIDWTVWAIFLLEYVLMAALRPQRILYIRRHPLHLAVVVVSYPGLPAIFGLVRLARLARVLRLVRLVGVTARAINALRIIFRRRGLLCVAGISILTVFTSG